MAFCLPKAEVQKFKAAVADGRLGMQELGKLTSDARRARIASVLGEENAAHVNALFEKGMLLERRKLGFSNWVKEVSGELSPQARENIVDKINKLDERILNPYFEKNFLGDLAREKLGVKLTPEQAKVIFEQAQEAKKLKEEWEKTLDEAIPYRDINNPMYKTRIDYGLQLQKLQDTIDAAKPSGKTWI